MKDRLLRALAEMENLRERSARQIEVNKQFAVQVPSCLRLLAESGVSLLLASVVALTMAGWHVLDSRMTMRRNWALQGFAKSLLDVADNLERAAGAVPAEALQQDGKLPAPELAKHLRTLLQGVQMTDNQLTAVSGRLLLLRNMLRLIAEIMHVSCCIMAVADRY